MQEQPQQSVKGKKRKKQLPAEESWRLSYPICEDTSVQQGCIEYAEPRPVAGCSESGKDYYLDQRELSPKREIVKVHIDGGVITEPEASTVDKCDYAFVIRGKGGSPALEHAVLVELKGKNLDHACKQIEATLDMPEWKELWKSVGTVHGRIVMSSVPRTKYSASYLKLKRRLEGRLEKYERSHSDKVKDIIG